MVWLLFLQFKPEGLHYERVFCILYFGINNAFNFWLFFYSFLLLASENYKLCCVANLIALIKQFKNSNARPQTDTSVKTIFMKWMKWWKMFFFLTICRRSTVTIRLVLDERICTLYLMWTRNLLRFNVFACDLR